MRKYIIAFIKAVLAASLFATAFTIAIMFVLWTTDLVEIVWTTIRILFVVCLLCLFVYFQDDRK
jgi:hypothetical protein